MLERPHTGLRKNPVSRAERQRAYRRRLRESRVIAPVEVDAATLNLLVRLGWLAERESGDRHRIGSAIAEPRRRNREHRKSRSRS